MKRSKQQPPVLHRGSLMTYQDNGTERCFGYLMHFPEHGIYEPTFGKLDVSAEDAQAHNRLLSQAEIEGLESNCTLGLGGMFYTRKAQDRTIVVTWLGDEVSRDVQVRCGVLTFKRKNMTFRGRLRRQQDNFAFRRIQ